ncbi:response regulator [Niabella pedocola]|uniref:histidine kinase n=1 Tax=Niabella pedocola TaxID=1752077 RepID=A0ABS8PM25_9BACT|nr:response regulator [Niabella pedocola]MCD2422165.1 response regulator [Niabella pedocola]
MPKKLIRKLQIGFGISLFILLATSAASFISIRKQIDDRRQVIHTQQLILSVTQILTDLQNAETGQRGYLLTGIPGFLEPYYNSFNALPSSIKNARILANGNARQMQQIDSIEFFVNKQLNSLKETVGAKKAGGGASTNELEQGKVLMDNCRKLIADFIGKETAMLEKSNAEMHRSSNITALFILCAAIASLLVTIYFYLQIRGEFKQREKIQRALKTKDEEITRRLTIIQGIAQKISAGDYTVRVNDAQKDDLGSIAASLNEMAASLQTSFQEINSNEWRQAGLVRLSEITAGNKTEEVLAKDTLAHLVNYGKHLNGALYLIDDDLLQLQSAYAMEPYMKTQYYPGEGMVGQVFENKKIRTLEHLSDSDYISTCATGQIRVAYLVWLPLLVKGQCMGVIELGSLSPFSALEMEFLRDACNTVTLEILAARSRKRVQMLLEETQSQAEELQAQHAELENLNTELEAQAQKLQASEEELRVQQEELLQSNQELEERSKLLEERNQLIAIRNKEIQKKAEELELSTKYKSEFLANMSHELRTPLNSILLLSRLMTENTDGNLNEDQVASAKVIQSSGSSLLSLIDEILDLSKIEAGKMELDYQEISVNALKNDLFNMFTPLATAKGLHFAIEVAPEAAQELVIDKQRLEQVLRNLLSNAIKFTQQGAVTLKIFPDPDIADAVTFAVHDTGIGISKENQRIIFEAFQQADGSTRRKFGGTGLGLSISRELARLLGGEIVVESIPGEGSIFTLTVPGKKPEAFIKPETGLHAAAGKVEEHSSMASEEQPLTVASIPEEVADDRGNLQPADKIILIVEDDVHFARELLKFSNQQGYKGIIVVRGDIAAQAAEQYQPVAILLDIRLPVKNGWMVMDEIKSNPRTRHIPVHIMSSMQEKKKSLLKGAIDFISKPIGPEQLGAIFQKVEDALVRNPGKVLIVEENTKHATALSYFLGNFNIVSEIKNSVQESIASLLSDRVNCVILDMGVPDKTGYETLEAIKQEAGLEDLPIIIFTGKKLSHAEELRIKQYADSVVIKTAHSFQRVLDEVGLFLHLVEENAEPERRKINKSGTLSEILKGKTVLIADDDVRNIFSLSKALEEYQMKVVSATDGKDALKQLADHPEISIILMDMMMPEMDGHETMQRIRSQPAYTKIPIIAVTAKAMTGDREKCIRSGASDYISKPVDKDQLLSLLRVWLYEN